MSTKRHPIIDHAGIARETMIEPDHAAPALCAAPIFSIKLHWVHLNVCKRAPEMPGWGSEHSSFILVRHCAQSGEAAGLVTSLIFSATVIRAPLGHGRAKRLAWEGWPSPARL
jgi:hypothetical protein